MVSAGDIPNVGLFMHSTILSIGSNIEPEKYCAKVLEVLREQTVFKASSKLIETEPWGFADQDNFLNGAVWLETPLDQLAFKAYLKSLEKQLDRVKTANKSGPRTIDLDIIIWDNNVVDEDYFEKPYVYIPINEIINAHQLNINGINKWAQH